MKKLYNGKTTNRVHPSPSPPASHLSSLPAAILTLATALSPEEQQVLSYLLGTTTTTTNNNHKSKHHQRTIKNQQHQPEFTCGCFLCYKSFWSRWDSSPNRHLIHLIIDAAEQHHQHNMHEEATAAATTRGRNRRSSSSRRTGKKKKAAAELEEDRKEVLPADSGHVADGEGGNENMDVEEEEEGAESKSSSVRRLVSFIGERVWGVWN